MRLACTETTIKEHELRKFGLIIQPLSRKPVVMSEAGGQAAGLYLTCINVNTSEAPMRLVMTTS